jgi:tetratricopeptide (TPR) repeat protein
MEVIRMTKNATVLQKQLDAARGYLTLEMPDHALRELRGIRDPGPAAFEIQQLRGEALRQKEEWDDALDAYRRSLDSDDGDLRLTSLMGMAWCYKRNGRVDMALSMMEKAYHADPKQPVILYNIACYHAVQGNKPQALSWLGRALRMEKALARLIPEEHDFDRLRNDPDFQFIANACT